MINYSKPILVALVTALTLSACSTVGDIKERHRQEDVAHRLGCEFYQEGVASWYGEGFRGRKTASGERFNPDHMTAAHRKLPFGSVVRVIRADGEVDKDGVELRINDRGPYTGGRVIDVSASAAGKLGFKGAGLAPVRVYLCE